MQSARSFAQKIILRGNDRTKTTAPNELSNEVSETRNICTTNKQIEEMTGASNEHTQTEQRLALGARQADEGLAPRCGDGRQDVGNHLGRTNE